VVADVADERGATVAASLPGASFRSLDVTSRAAVDAAAAELGRVDVLVNSAGTAARHPAEDFPEEEWDRILRLNLKGTFLPCQAFGRLMLAQRSGSIINLASIGASFAYPHATAYLQSKGGIAQLTRSLALEWIDRGVRVNALAPTLFDTPLVAASARQSTVTSDFIRARQVCGRNGRPEEIVGPAVFLASDAASMVNGHVLQVDGGYAIA
jgi:2-deoxy-D-gluconate 3-dehydrogenase